jgi:hypothetical protein
MFTKDDYKMFVSNDLQYAYYNSLDTNLLQSSFVNIIVIPEIYEVFENELLHNEDLMMTL